MNWEVIGSPRSANSPYIVISALLALLMVGPVSACSKGQARENQGQSAESRWEDDIRELERDNRGAPKGGVVFVGSSSIRLWSSLEDDMAPVSVVKSGFGGARSSDVLRFTERLVVPHEPSAIVFYAGDNDLGGNTKASPSVVRDNFAAFVSAVRKAGLSPAFYFVSIKPSPKRAARWPTMQQANALVAAFAKQDGHVNYVDVSSAMLTASGAPRPELFQDDGLHLNEFGYAVWTRALKPILQSQVGPNPLYL